ncbi:hypothetical protein [Corynebacterium sp. UMB10119B.1]|uniref:hypothetical protein n=1 Tax=Corynebacterium sp. UMB10119B.1 TaxID=3050601 RepID=UPI00254E0812|nr:hypothetical protein [Corynebacterium sp. UMB10119B]MDK8364318.1 hypothetical protein [Corynebacterium sp. UMB10119B]
MSTQLSTVLEKSWYLNPTIHRPVKSPESPITSVGSTVWGGVNAVVGILLPQRFRLRGLADAEVAHALRQERSLLYVAASRARDALLVTTHGEPSDILPEV